MVRVDRNRRMSRAVLVRPRASSPRRSSPAVIARPRRTSPRPARMRRATPPRARDAGAQRRRRGVAAARRSAGLRGRAARARRRRRRRRDRRAPTARRSGTRPRTPSSHGDAPASVNPEPVAAGEAQRHPRPLRGHRRRLPGARLRPLEHDAHRGQDRLDRRRPAHLARDRRARRSRWRASTSATQPIVAVIFTHSHVDHFGGIEAVLPRRSGGARADPHRRAARLPRRGDQRERARRHRHGAPRAASCTACRSARSARGHVDTGLGKQPARGTIDIAEPTDLVDHTPQEMEIDGVRFVFQYAPDSEAPAELTFYLPEQQGLLRRRDRLAHACTTSTRCAAPRCATRCGGAATSTTRCSRFGDAEVVFASHHWPVWGNARVVDYLKKQRDTYRYIHDQTLRLANAGRDAAGDRRAARAAARRCAPAFADRGYYGTVRHNAKAVYQ